MDAPTTGRTDPHQGWIRRPWCLWVSVGLVLLGAILNTVYLFNHCPIDLSEDEAHYWEWSRHLDYGYYSKPPGIAWVIWAAVKVGGLIGVSNESSGEMLMPVVRMPAVIFGMCTGLLSLLLARRMFRDDRAALAGTLLSAAVPMFAVGSLLITIDSPMYLCWAGTIYALWRTVEDNAQFNRPSVAWLYVAGFACALGMLFKPVLMAIPLSGAVGAWATPSLRRAFGTWHALGAAALVLLSQVPVVIWNSHHGWVTFRHILTQGGLGRQTAEATHSSWWAPVSRLGEFVGGQAGAMGGIMFVLLVIAVAIAWRYRVSDPAGPNAATKSFDQLGLAMNFLLTFTLPLWGFYLVMNLWKRTEVNWPATSYFTGMILLAGVVTQGWNSADLHVRRNWRVWTCVAVVWGMLLTGVALNLHRLYPALAGKIEPLVGTPQYDQSFWNPRKWDPSAGKLRGMAERAQAVQRFVEEMHQQSGQEPLIITGRYDTSSSLAFYLPGHPFVYCFMSHLGGRQSQYDLWPGLNETVDDDGQKKFKHAGTPAIIVGIYPAGIECVVKPAFERVEGPILVPVKYHGVILREIVIYRAWGVRGIPQTSSEIY
jgi:4-amino-4-deoxy-L-arabinose transferase-like glycosyltransferase